MKKFFMLLALTVLLIVPTTVFAAQKTELPVTMRHQPTYTDDVYSVTLKKVEVKRIKASKSSVKIYFDIDYSDPSGYGETYIRINCYDADGEFLETVNFYKYDASASVPIATASIEFTVKNPASRHNTYIYRNPFVTMYAADGRTQIVADTDIEANKAVGWFTAPPVTVYSADGTSLAIEPSDVEAYIADGWFTVPVTTMYSADGKTQVFPTEDVEANKAVGWFTAPPITMYSVDGRTQLVSSDEIYANKAVGWFTAPPITMYAADGRTLLVDPTDVEANKAVGWYEYPVVAMYAIDGRTQVVAKTDIEANKAVGWYEYPVTTMYAIDGRTQVVAKTDVEANKAVGWYEYPVTAMYAIDGRTIVVQSSQTEAYKNEGWYSEPVKILHSYDNRAIIVGESEVAAYTQVGWYDKDDLKQKYSLTDSQGIKNFIKTFYPVVVTATGRYSFDVKVSVYDNRFWIRLEYDYSMVSDASYNINMGIEQRVQAKKDIRQFMYVLANDVMRRTSSPVEIQFYRGGYKYPALKVGYNSTTFLTAKNYKDEYVKASDGSYMSTRKMVGFYWDTAGDDYDF